MVVVVAVAAAEAAAAVAAGAADEGAAEAGAVDDVLTWQLACKCWLVMNSSVAPRVQHCRRMRRVSTGRNFVGVRKQHVALLFAASFASHVCHLTVSRCKDAPEWCLLQPVKKGLHFVTAEQHIPCRTCQHAHQ